jgi:allantoate deiminase
MFVSRAISQHSWSSVPTPMFRGELVGAAKIIVELQAIASDTQGAPSVKTVGSIKTFPD